MNSARAKGYGLIVLAVISLCAIIALAAVLKNTGKNPNTDVPTTAYEKPSIGDTVPTHSATTSPSPSIPSVNDAPTTTPPTMNTPTTTPQPTNPKPTEHTHSYEEAVTAATCTEKGYTTYTCVCGNFYTGNEVDALGHVYDVWVTTKEPTEMTVGLARRDCMNCDKYETKELDKVVHEHHYSSETVEPTCTEPGYTFYTCTCGHTYRDDEIPASGHEWTDWNVVAEATEVAPGKEVRSCGLCLAKEEREIPKLEHAHNYTNKVTEPTCTEKGYTAYTCACGHTYKDNYVKAAGHAWDNWETTVAPTETTTGIATRYCRACEKAETKVLDTVDHVHSYTVSETKEPTCTMQGWSTYVCPCGEEYTETLHTVPHSWTEWEVVKEATEAASGERVRSCKGCWKEERELVLPLEHTHTYTDTVVAPTCKADGYTLHSCDCGYSYQDAFVKAPGHNNVVDKIPASCTAKPCTRYTCQTCGNVYEKTTGKVLGHDYSDWVIVKAPTGTESGLQERSCSRCAEVDAVVLPAAGEERDTYIDPKIEINSVGWYSYGALRVDTTYCSYNCYLSITVLENDNFFIRYYKKDGTKVEYTLRQPPDEYCRRFTIDADGNYSDICYGNYT